MAKANLGLTKSFLNVVPLTPIFSDIKATNCVSVTMRREKSLGRISDESDD